MPSQTYWSDQSHGLAVTFRPEVINIVSVRPLWTRLTSVIEGSPEHGAKA